MEDHKLLIEDAQTSPREDPSEFVDIDIDEPVEVREHESALATLWETFFNITKSIVGAGSFALPYCMKNMGVVLGSLTIVILGVVCTYAVLILLECKQHLVRKTQNRDLTYVDIGRASFGKWMSRFVYLCLIVAAIGASSSYVVFIGTTLYEAFGTRVGISVIGYKLIATAILIPLSWLRTLKALSNFSALGTLALLLGLCVTMAYGFKYERENIRTTEPELFRFDTYFHSFGSVAFLFCISFLVLPIERSMKDNRLFWLPLTASVVAVTITNIIFAILGYLFFGAAIEDNILNNLTEPDVLVDIVKVAVCFDLLFTFPLVFSPAREVIENSILHRSTGWMNTKRNIIRTVLVIMTFGVAQIPTFSIITNIVGIPMSILAFVLPPLMHIALEGRDSFSTPKLLVYYSMVAGGTLCAILTTVFSFL